MGDSFAGLSSPLRILLFVLLALAVHVVVRVVRRLAEALLQPEGGEPIALVRRYPRLVTVGTLVVSAVTFALYFAAFGFVLREFGVSLTTYFASATIIGLAVGFGSQGLVQDVVTGITLIFSDALNVNDVVEFAGQVGRVEQIGLRFTTLAAVRGPEIIVPNRNITQIIRYPGGTFQAVADVQVPACAESLTVAASLRVALEAFAEQHAALVLDARTLGLREAGAWRYVRLRLRIVPGQQALIDTALPPRLLAALQQHDSTAAAWMITLTYRTGADLDVAAAPAPSEPFEHVTDV